MRVRNIVTGDIYDSIEAALKSGDIMSPEELASEIDRFIEENETCFEINGSGFKGIWNMLIYSLACQIKDENRLEEFDLKLCQKPLSVGDKVTIIDKAYLHIMFSKIFEDFEKYGLTVEDIAQYCYYDNNPSLVEKYVIRAIADSRVGTLLFIKGEISGRGYIINSRGVEEVEDEEN